MKVMSLRVKITAISLKDSDESVVLLAMFHWKKLTGNVAISELTKVILYLWNFAQKNQNSTMQGKLQSWKQWAYA